MNKILFLDTLTTGMNPERCAIYRLGGVFCEDTPDGIEEKKRFELFVRPFETARISENSLWTGGVTRSHLIYFPEQSEAFKDFIRLTDERVNIRNSRDKIYIAGFNTSSFDVPFLVNWFIKNGDNRFRDRFYVQTLDIMSLAAFALIEERQGMPDFHLETAAKALGVCPTKNSSYSCLDNALTCIDMYRSLKTRLKVGDNNKYITVDDTYLNHNFK